MDIYIKPNKKVSFQGQKIVRIKDIGDVIAPSEHLNQINEIIVLDRKNEKSYLVSITDVVKLILNKFPNATVINLGEMDIWLEFEVKGERSKIQKFLLVTVISFIVFMGSLTTIMSFHTDTQITKVFQNFYQIFTGEYVEKPYIIEIPYSIGLGLGVIVFFNHFGGKKLTTDPTPIEIEMATYRKNIEDTIINALSKQKAGKKGDKKK